MARPAERDDVARAVRKHLTLAAQSSEGAIPLDVKSVAAATGYARSTLYKYGLQRDIQRMAEKRSKNGSASAAEQEDAAYADRLQALREELDLANERNLGLVARFALVEGNAARLGIDPEELYKPLPQPDRRTSRAGAAGRKARKR